MCVGVANAALLVKVSSQAGTSPGTAAAGIIVTVALLSLLLFGGVFVANVFALTLPAYSSFKAVRSEHFEDDKQWCAVCFRVFVCDCLFSRLLVRLFAQADVLGRVCVHVAAGEHRILDTVLDSLLLGAEDRGVVLAVAGDGGDVGLRACCQAGDDARVQANRQGECTATQA